MSDPPDIDEIDFNELYELLLDATRKAFRFAQESHPDETFYAFGLYHHDWLGYMLPTCNTEEALTRSCENAGPDNDSMKQRWTMERWSPCDWEYHILGDDFFSSVQDWFHDFEAYMQKFEAESDSEPSDEFYVSCQNLMMLTTRRVLATLDEEKLFGEGVSREKIVLNIMEGDQGSDWIETARLLNPSSTYKRWLSEVQAGYDAFFTLSS